MAKALARFILTHVSAAAFLQACAQSGGPVVQAPAVKGFGRVVIEDTMKRSLRAQVTIEYPPQGLVWCARVPEPFTTIESAHRTKTDALDV